MGEEHSRQRKQQMQNLRLQKTTTQAHRRPCNRHRYRGTSQHCVLAWRIFRHHPIASFSDMGDPYMDRQEDPSQILSFFPGDTYIPVAGRRWTPMLEPSCWGTPFGLQPIPQTHQGNLECEGNMSVGLQTGKLQRVESEGGAWRGKRVQALPPTLPIPLARSSLWLAAKLK